ncbi:MAG TPA: aspartyl protease [Verrucomicrobiota bacterium]|nr:aspartyl protease [Verrucomicrobiales bacterium]HRI15971.1 aspartyl protease [Verrucomicrobiota bacterium]
MTDMGKVTIQIKLQNWDDLALLATGKRKRPARGREVEAMVDTGAVKLYLQRSVIEGLGLRHIGEVRSRTMSDQTVKRRVFSPVDLEIQGRSGRFDVVEVPDSLPNLVGQIPLEDLDLVVDCQGRQLIPNPEHKNGVMYDEF